MTYDDEHEPSEIEALFAELSSCDGLTVHEATCLYESQRRRDCEEQRRREMADDPGYAARVRERQREAQRRSRARRRAEAPWRPMVQLALRLDAQVTARSERRTRRAA